MFRSHSLEFLRERLWFALFSVFILIILSLYTWLGSNAFYITGPSLLFFLALTQFPLLVIWWKVIEQERGPQTQRVQKTAQKINTLGEPVPKFYVSTTFPTRSNICLLASGKRHWFIAHPDFLSELSDAELFEALEVAQELFHHKVTQRATLLSALQCFLFFLPWSHHRGNELCFYSVRKKLTWSRLLFEKCLSHNTAERTPRYLSPTLIFPVLTNYDKKSYYSLYVHLRSQWLEQTNSTLNSQTATALNSDLKRDAPIEIETFPQAIHPPHKSIPLEEL